MSTQVTDGQLRELVATRAYAEPAFRTALIANPKAAIEGIIGTSLPASLKVSVIEEQANNLSIVIPQAATDELSDEQLSAVAGGLLDASGKGSAACFNVGNALVNTKLELNL